MRHALRLAGTRTGHVTHITGRGGAECLGEATVRTGNDGSVGTISSCCASNTGYDVKYETATAYANHVRHSWSQAGEQ